MGFKKTIPLNEFITLQRGFDLPKDERIAGNVPVIASTGIGGYHNETKVNAPGVVIGRSGSIGGGQYITVDFWPLNTTLWVKDFKGHHPRYVYYLLKSIDFSQFNVGSGVPTLNRNHLSGVLVANTSYKYEKKIADIIGSLDDRIEFNKKINQTLEQMAQTLFKSWFVDFDPVIDNALDAGNPIPTPFQERAELRQKVRKSADFKPLSTEIRALFPAKFEETELGWVPKGWSYQNFGNILLNTIGGDWGSDVPNEKHSIQARIIRGTDIPEILSGKLSSAPIRWVEPKKLKTRRIEAGDIIIEVSGGSPKQPTGRSIFMTEELITQLGGIVEPASFCRKFQPKSMELGLLASTHLKKIYDEGKTWEYQNQSTGIANFQTKFFLETEQLVVPEDAVLNKFFDLVMPVISKSHSNEQTMLTQLRDTLLPKLISGELSLDDLPEAINEAKAA
ncbi:hypothetical protein B5C26_01335 [Photorhabdus luminescens]|uniref:restriction endonuclease subunit S n=1 Tax=Photorhabdus luminescens TaxID=29488 RepID=UPI000B4DCC1B|nr:restriction endonuclease subunit S [Photorhabdus luminescens]OWO86429.1 hypothetical protein B5C26_01335 [Photorhabdus luminescens]